MNRTLLLITLILILALPVYALDCNQKPCHKKCISNQSQAIKTQCWCNARKKVYYHYGRNIGVPEYNEVCDGSIQQYKAKYCDAKRRYDNALLSHQYSNYIPQYDENCDGSYEYYTQTVLQLQQTRAMQRMTEALSQPVQVNVNHSGTVKQNIQLDGTIRHMNYWY